VSSGWRGVDEAMWNPGSARLVVFQKLRPKIRPPSLDKNLKGEFEIGHSWEPRFVSSGTQSLGRQKRLGRRGDHINCSKQVPQTGGCSYEMSVS
jgi:hypothetical protein